MSVDIVSRGWNHGSQVKNPLQTGGGAHLCHVLLLWRCDGDVGKGWRTKSPGTSTYVISFYRQGNRGSERWIDFSVSLSKWQSQDLTMGMRDSKFKKYLVYAMS